MSSKHERRVYQITKMLLSVCLAIVLSITSTNMQTLTLDAASPAVILNRTTYTLKVGKTVKLKAVVSKKSLKGKPVVWKSSKTAVATVNSKGKVTAKKKGTATITATIQGTGKKAVCKITVIKKTTDTTVPDENKSTLPPMNELERAEYYGFLPASLSGAKPDSTITWKQYCNLIANMIQHSDDSLTAKWKELSRLARKSNDKMLRDQGCFVLYQAMELMGLENIDYDYLSVTPNPHEIEYGSFSNEYRAFTGDGKDGWVFEDIETVDFGTRSYIETAVMACHQRLSLASFELLYDPDISINKRLTVHDAICSVVRLYESQIDIADGLWSVWQKELLAEVSRQDEAAEITDLRKSILESRTGIKKSNTYIPGETYSGTAYYVSNNGNDADDGQSPDTAWASLERVSREVLSSGDAVFLERGGMYRGYLNLWDPDGGVTLSAYGEGEKPVVTSSLENAADPSRWELYDERGNGAKIWKYAQAVTDCGTIVFDDSMAGRKITAIWSGKKWLNAAGSAFDVSAELTKNLDFFCNDGGKFNGAKDSDDVGSGKAPDVKYGPLYLRCDDGNPGTLFQDIEICSIPVRQDDGEYQGSVISTVDNVTIDNICIKYYPMSGIDYGNTGCVIQNCEFAWGGGCAQIIQNGKVTGRAGDALCGGGATGMKLFNNYFHDLFSQALIFEADGRETKDVLFSGNLLERTAGINIAYDNGNISQLVITDNIFSQSGLSWADQQLMGTDIWSGGEWCKDIRIRLFNSPIECQIRNNSFYNPLQFSLFYCSDRNREIPEMGNNKYYMPKQCGFFAWWQRSDIYQLYDTITCEDAEAFLRDTLHDTTSEVILMD